MRNRRDELRDRDMKTVRGATIDAMQEEADSFSLSDMIAVATISAIPVCTVGRSSIKLAVKRNCKSHVLAGNALHLDTGRGILNALAVCLFTQFVCSLRLRATETSKTCDRCSCYGSCSMKRPNLHWPRLTLCVLAMTTIVACSQAYAAKEKKPLKAGDTAPEFVLKGTDGKTHKLSEFTKQKTAVVVAWYPKALTGG